MTDFRVGGKDGVMFPRSHVLEVTHMCYFSVNPRLIRCPLVGYHVCNLFAALPYSYTRDKPTLIDCDLRLSSTSFRITDVLTGRPRV